MKLKPTIAVAAAALTLVAVGGIAGASIPGSDGVISACYLTQTGTVRIIDAATQSCKPSETAINWNQAGAPGAPGAPGLSRYTQVSLDDNHTFEGDPVGFFGVTITCPTGRKVLGGGANVSGFRGIEALAVFLKGSFPLDDNRWRVEFGLAEGEFIEGDQVFYHLSATCADAV